MDQGWDKGIGRVVDVLGFNYRTNQIEAYHGRHPEQPVYGSETGSTVATRGEYANDADAPHRPRLRHRASVVGDDRRGMVDHRRRPPVHRRRLRLDRLRLSRRADAFRRRSQASARSSASSTPAASRRTIIITTAPGGGPISRSCTCCRTGTGRDGRGSRSRSGHTAIPRRSSCCSTADRSAARRCRATATSSGVCLMRRGGSRRSAIMAASGRARRARDNGAGACGRLIADRRGSRRTGDVVILNACRGGRRGGSCRPRTTFSASRRATAMSSASATAIRTASSPTSPAQRKAFNGLAQAIVRVGRRGAGRRLRLAAPDLRRSRIGSSAS